jgi:hypothetical protein
MEKNGGGPTSNLGLDVDKENKKKSQSVFVAK